MGANGANDVTWAPWRRRRAPLPLVGGILFLFPPSFSFCPPIFPLIPYIRLFPPTLLLPLPNSPFFLQIHPFFSPTFLSHPHHSPPPPQFTFPPPPPQTQPPSPPPWGPRCENGGLTLIPPHFPPCRGQICAPSSLMQRIPLPSHQPRLTAPFVPSSQTSTFGSPPPPLNSFGATEDPPPQISPHSPPISAAMDPQSRAKDASERCCSFGGGSRLGWVQTSCRINEH